MELSIQTIGVPLEGFAAFSRQVSAEGAVLLKNDWQTLPLIPNDEVSIFGRTQINYYRSGTGSGGSVNVMYTTNLLDGLRSKTQLTINEELASLYIQWIMDNPFDNKGGGWAAEPWHQKEMPLTDELVAKARNKSNKAIVVIGRTAGEDKDNAVESGSYLLKMDELAMLKTVAKYFEQTTLVLNVSNIIEMSWLYEEQFVYPISSVIYAWHGGMEGGNTIADVLTGDVTPSGKLTDTIAYSIEDYPSTHNYGNEHKNLYQEDIYVGYRYFETFCPDKVLFPFGYGLSYTDFQIEEVYAQVTTKNGEANLEVSAIITNVGTQYAGQEVLQVYFEAPQGKLGKPSKVLSSFYKTKVLEPGKSQSLSVSFPVSAMASYDDAGASGHASAYVLEPGIYRIYVGNSVRNVTLVHVDGQEGYRVNDLRVVQQLEEVLMPTEAFARLKPGKERTDGTYELAYEQVPTRRVNLAERIERNLPQALAQTGNRGYTLRDVHDEKINMETLIAQLNDEELAMIVRGEGMSNPLVTPGTASAFGGVSESLLAYGIPIACAADGPSGIRMDSGHKATQIAIGTLLAATWNPELIEKLYVMEGKELLSNQIDTLLGPGMNIRRSPLNGRNFEYFSEDPLITGVFTAACTRGVIKGGSTATLKHFACNNQEKFRRQVNAVVSERALREIYLKAFEIAVKQGDANAIMTAYNPINGYWAASNYDLNTTVLRKEWGFTGIVMTDWWAMMNDPVQGGPPDIRNTAAMVRSQNDLFMVVPNFGAETNLYGDNTLASLENGALTRGELQRCAINICRFLMMTPAFNRHQEINGQLPAFKANPFLEPQRVQVVSDNAHIKLETADSTYLQVDQSGPYQIVVKVMNPETLSAQSACNVSLNGEHMTTIQCNGTLGKWVRQRLTKVELEAGLYKMQIAYIKPGLQIEWLDFRRVY